MHDLLRNTWARRLGRLLTDHGAVMIDGGADFGEDGSGYFIPAPRAEYPPVSRDRAGIVQTLDGDLIPVRDLALVAITRSLPRRYTFTHALDLPKLATKGVRARSRQSSNRNCPPVLAPGIVRRPHWPQPPRRARSRA